MKKFRCWYIAKRYGWIFFEKEFVSKKAALEYCESRTDFPGSSIVEEAEE